MMTPTIEQFAKMLGVTVGQCRALQQKNREQLTEARANAERIVSCVNACAGMADPMKEIEEMREALWVFEAWLVAPDLSDGTLKEMQGIVRAALANTGANHA